MAAATLSMQTLDVNGLRMQVAVQGSGPLVLLCHGFPELWISWRAQLDALAAAGYRAVAPDMRGYGGTSAPDDVTAYTQLHLVGDMVDLVRALGETQAVIVGHDWGAPVAWNAALLRPDVFRAVVGMSVPFAPPGRVEMLSALSQAGMHDFYLQYFLPKRRSGRQSVDAAQQQQNKTPRARYEGAGHAAGVGDDNPPPAQLAEEPCHQQRQKKAPVAGRLHVQHVAARQGHQ